MSYLSELSYLSEPSFFSERSFLGELSFLSELWEKFLSYFLKLSNSFLSLIKILLELILSYQHATSMLMDQQLIPTGSFPDSARPTAAPLARFSTFGITKQSTQTRTGTSETMAQWRWTRKNLLKLARSSSYPTGRNSDVENSGSKMLWTVSNF